MSCGGCYRGKGRRAGGGGGVRRSGVGASQGAETALTSSAYGCMAIVEEWNCSSVLVSCDVHALGTIKGTACIHPISHDKLE